MNYSWLIRLPLSFFHQMSRQLLYSMVWTFASSLWVLWEEFSSQLTASFSFYFPVLEVKIRYRHKDERLHEVCHLLIMRGAMLGSILKSSLVWSNCIYLSSIGSLSALRLPRTSSESQRTLTHTTPHSLAFFTFTPSNLHWKEWCYHTCVLSQTEIMLVWREKARLPLTHESSVGSGKVAGEGGTNHLDKSLNNRPLRSVESSHPDYLHNRERVGK